MHWTGGWGMGFGGLFMIAFWVLVIIGVVLLIKLIIGGSKSEGKTETALDVLKKRYAGGEINKEEFEEKKKDLL
ncbi:MAG TPA: SHOCT domain-containing protein [Nitrospirae bacterium]|nr:SHOCT domain-containing protein [Nitrospirota bacterium]